MGKFVIKNVKTGIKFVLKATNGQVILDSEVYSGDLPCVKGIESVRRNCLGGIEDQTVENFEALPCPKFEVYLDKAGEYRFRLKATNGQNICHSEGYKAMASCMNGIESVRKNAADSEIVKAE